MSATPDGKLVASTVWTTPEFESSRKGDVELRSFPDGKVMQRLPAAGAVAISPDGTLLVTGAGDALRWWDLPSGKPRPTIEGSAKAVRRDLARAAC